MKISYLPGMAAVLLSSSIMAEELLDMSLEELMDVKVTTASKGEQKLSEATSVMSVVTRKDIENSGVRTLQEALRRVPGFFVTRQSTWSMYSSRGLVSDGNDHFLLLVDGHSQNSIIGQGSAQQDIIPNLEMVERIEVIRGPGSVLWGSAAVMGIVNIITKSGEDKKNHAGVNYRTEDGMRTANYQQAFNGENYNGNVSLTAWKAKGYWDSKYKGTGGYYSWQRALPCCQGGDVNPVRPETQYESYDMYAHFTFGAAELKARLLDQSTNYFWDSYGEPTSTLESELRLRKAYLDYSNKKKLSDSFLLSYNVYVDLMIQNRWPKNFHGYQGVADRNWDDYGVIEKRMQDVSDEERAVGGEMLLTKEWNEKNSTKLGIKYVQTRLGPNRDTKMNIITNKPSSGADNTANVTSQRPNYIGLYDAVDRQKALYIEHSSKFFEKFALFAGARFDMNDYRENKNKLLPRGGVIFSPTDSFTAKYVYNTGYFRPNAKYSKSVSAVVDQNTSGAVALVKQSESIQSHEMQLSLAKGRTYGTATGYYMVIDDYINDIAFSGGTELTSRKITRQGYYNVGKATSYGLELEAKQGLKGFLFYGNYSLSKSKLSSKLYRHILTDEKGEIINVPRHIINAGFDLTVSTNSILNVHGNAILKEKINTGGPLDNASAGTAPWTSNDNLHRYETVSRYYLDCALTQKNIIIAGFDAQFYINNILNNTKHLGYAINTGYFRPMGRSLGLKMTYDF